MCLYFGVFFGKCLVGKELNFLCHKVLKNLGHLGYDEILLMMITICEELLLFLLAQTSLIIISVCSLTSSNSYQKKRDKNTRCWLSARAKPLSHREENPSTNFSY